MKPEARLLLLCARTTLDHDQRESCRELCNAGLDWGLVDALALRHGLHPLLHRHLESLEAGTVPREVLASLWARHETRSRRNRDLTRELLDIAALLERESIRYAPYKGPTLALAAYGDLALRQFGDLDLLVRAADAPHAQRVLERIGYRPEYVLTPDLAQALFRSTRHYELPLRDDARGFLVELHWRADPDDDVVPLADDRWWQDLDRIEIGGGSVPMLRANDLMLVLCLHGTKHSWVSLGWLVDVAELAKRTPDLDWEVIANRAREMGAERKLGIALALACELLDAPIPLGAMRAADDPVVRRVVADIRAGLFDPGFDPPAVGQIVRRNAELRMGALARLRYLLRALFVPGLGEWLRWQLPRPLFFLYYPLRLSRLAGKYLRKSA
ncbi:MAG TPA: nucleotidyltransferase family protein [Usitatibacter sp.]|jgi:hypothetical protein|nr:nucleotidyltransferase family protein [Usitatibacter sp.]